MESVIGVRVDKILKRFLFQTPTSFEVAKQDVRLAGALIDIDETTGKARSIERWSGISRSRPATGMR
ncbi:MAG: YmdB family metallophosphoesterase [Thermoanaerobaculia bacterium]